MEWSEQFRWAFLICSLLAFLAVLWVSVISCRIVEESTERQMQTCIEAGNIWMYDSCIVTKGDQS